MVLLSAEVTMAAPYSMDLRTRVLKAWDASGDADDVAATFGVSRAWVHRLAQRQRETGSIAPRRQTKFRARVLAGHEERLKALVNATPDATLAELRDALPTTAALSTVWLEVERLGLTIKKPYTPTNSVVLMSRLAGASGGRRSRSAMRASMSSSTSRA
jgi:transposase